MEKNLYSNPVWTKCSDKLNLSKADDVEGEFAVITGEMTEAEYAQKAEEMPEVVKMIRMAD